MVLQPGLVDLALPRDGSSLLGPDLAFLAPNCIYPSQKLQALSKFGNFFSAFDILVGLIWILFVFSVFLVSSEQSPVEQPL